MPFESATEQLRALQQNEVTSLDLVEATIARIEELDGTINAVVIRDFDRARRAALAADRERAAGGGRPLLGLPVTVKEAFDLEGTATTWGLPGTHLLAKTDSTLVDRVRGAGAIILGKTNVAMMLADWQTTNPVFGLTRNPWDTSRTPGGSSGGGAAAVATGMTALDFGSDLAGSLEFLRRSAGCGRIVPATGWCQCEGLRHPWPRDPRSQHRSISAQWAQSQGMQPICDWRSTWSPDPRPSPQPPIASHYLPRVTMRCVSSACWFSTHILWYAKTSDDIKGALANVADSLEREGCRVGRAVGKNPRFLRDLTETFVALLMSLMGADTPKESYIWRRPHEPKRKAASSRTAA